MKCVSYLLLSLAFIFYAANSNAQKLSYSPAEVEAIHDSINRSRWDAGGPISQYSFRYMSEFFRTAQIYKSNRPFTFTIASKKPLEKLKVKSGRDSLLFDNYLKQLHIAGFIVIHKGSIVYEKYFSMLPEDRHTLQSITKVITSTIITSLVNAKNLDLDQPISKYISELAGTEWQDISVRNILNMRSGMDSYSIAFETGPFTNPKHKNYQLESALDILPKTPNTPESPYQFIAGLKKDKLPGLKAEYSNINTFVLGWLAERITGKKYADLVSEIIWKPMGASSDAYVCMSQNGIPWPHGGISATLRDLARFGMMFTKTEMRRRKEDLISFAQLNEIFEAPPIANSIYPFKWVYQWDLAGDGFMMKSGFGGQALYIYPEKEIVVAYFNYIDKDWSVDNSISTQALKEIIRVVESN